MQPRVRIGEHVHVHADASLCPYLNNFSTCSGDRNPHGNAYGNAEAAACAEPTLGVGRDGPDAAADEEADAGCCTCGVEGEVIARGLELGDEDGVDSDFGAGVG